LSLLGAVFLQLSVKHFIGYVVFPAYIFHFLHIHFLSRVSILLLTRDVDIVILSVCPSVRDTLVLHENGLTYRHSFSPYGSPIIPVLRAPNIFTKFRRGHPCGGAKYRWGIKLRDFLPISRYISQTIQDIAMVAMEDE